MATKSPTSLRSREIIGVEQFSQRREVFGKHDTVFLPPASPVSMVPAFEVDPIFTSNHAKTISNFKRNAPGYSSMRESRNDDIDIEFRPRKYSDNFTSELNQSDDADYRYSAIERTRRLSKLRREFLKSNLHEPSNESPFMRVGTRASMPASSVMKYKIESPNLYKFPFAEPYATPPPVRRVIVDLGPPEINEEKENQEPEIRSKARHQSLPGQEISSKIDHQKLFEELVKRYSPQRKPINWNLPPTRPRVVGSVPKSTSSATSYDVTDKKVVDGIFNKSDDDVFLKKDDDVTPIAVTQDKPKENNEETPITTDATHGEPGKAELPNNVEIKPASGSKTSLAELEEKNDEVPELSPVRKLSKEHPKRPSLEKYTDLTIPALLDKMTEQAESEPKKKEKKVKRKRSFLDKLLGRKKDK